MNANEFDVSAPDGVTIRGTRWLPGPDDPGMRAVVVIAHGMAEHGARYARFGDALASHGYAVYAPDHRGHGETARGATLGHFGVDDGWARVTEDIDLVVSLAATHHPGAPIVLFGHSMGSLVARTYAGRHGERLTALILSGSPADPGRLGRVGQVLARGQARVRGAAHASGLLDRVSFGRYNKAFEPVRTPFDWLSRDEAEVDAYIADDKCGFVCSAGFYDDMLGGLRLVNTSAFVSGTPAKLPVLIISGDADPAGDNGTGVEAVATLLREGGVENVTTVLYTDARHELLHETNRDEVTEDVLRWLDLHVPPSV